LVQKEQNIKLNKVESLEQARGFMSHYSEYRKECFGVDTFEDDDGLFALKSVEEENRLHIEECWVKPEMRNKKVAQRYQEIIFQMAKDEGYKYLSTSVSLSNKNATETVAKLLHNDWKLGWTNGDYIGLIKEVV